MPKRLARHPRVLAFTIGGAGVVAELLLLALLAGGPAPRDTAQAPGPAGTRLELPAAESATTILLKPMELSL